MRKVLFLSLLALFAPLAFATSPALVGTPVGCGSTTGSNTTTTGTCSYTIATAGDDLEIILYGQSTSSSFALSSITPSSGSLTTDIAFSTLETNLNYLGAAIYRIHSATAQTYTITVTWNAASVRWGIILAEISGISSVDGTTPAETVGNSASVATGSVTTSNDGDLVVAVSANGQGSNNSYTWTSPFSQTAAFGETSVGMNISLADDTQTTHGAISAAATITSTVWVSAIIAYSGSATSSCTHYGQTAGGNLVIPNGTSGSYLLKDGSIGTPDCSTIYYKCPKLGNFCLN